MVKSHFCKYPCKILLLLLLLSSCAAVKDRKPKIDSFGFVEPNSNGVREIKTALEMGEVEKFQNLLISYKFSGQEEKIWQAYFQGVDLIQKKKNAQALKLLKSFYHTQITKTELSKESYRVLGKILKKIGWLYRENKNYDQAFVYHHYQLGLLKGHGSAIEIHDAYISVDMDVYNAKNPHLSELYLYESLRIAKKIKNKRYRAMAIGMTMNNLGGTQYQLEKFKAAESTILKGLRAWQQYEAIAGDKENRLVWAYFSVGDVYEHWAMALKAEKLDYDFNQKRRWAKEAYEKSLSLAQKRSMSENVIKKFNASIKRVKQL